MKTSLRLLLFTLLFFSVSCSQKKKSQPLVIDSIPNDSRSDKKQEPVSNPYATVDVSPMDMSYYPADYPKLKMSHATNIPPLARVVYSRPHLQGRRLFHDSLKHGEYILKYSESWRLGANEATELQLYKNVTIQGKQIPAGRYILYCIPQPDKWTIVVNSNLDSWGLTQDSTKDIARFDVAVKNTNPRLEFFTMVFEKTGNGAELIMAWDTIEARLPIVF
jgi:Protein of unknown function (DUF2911)